MHILAFNGSPRKEGNTSAIIRSILDGAKSAGAITTEVLLHHISMKGCTGCLGCRKNPGFCSQEDQLSQYLEELKTCEGFVIGSPIYMYHVSGQMKCLVDRLYSFYINRDGEPGAYDSALPAGKSYALVTSQGEADGELFKKPIRWLAGMTGIGLGAEEAGRIIHTGSDTNQAKNNSELLKEAFKIGIKLATRQQ